MKLKKKIFPYMLFLAILLTGVGLMSANISFSSPINSNYSFNIQVSDVESENIDLISYDNSNISYIVKLSDIIQDYSISFEILNDSDFNVLLSNSMITELPQELSDILDVNIKMSNRIEKNKKDIVVISYKLKDNLTNNQINTLKKYKEFKVDALFNYTQE